MNRILPKNFFARPVLDVAPELLGKRLVRQEGERQLASIITEVEAYDGPEDKACHGAKGETERTRAMFGPAGHWYVYLVYGMHWMLNIVTDEPGYPAAVLIRGVKDVEGPGRLTKYFDIGKPFYGLPAVPETGLWIEEDLPAGKAGIAVTKKDIKRTPRVGVDYAGEWAKKPYRFILKEQT